MAFDGEGSDRRSEPETPCRRCGVKGIDYTGSRVLHGNPYSPAADTEVEHFYRCPRCSHRWSRLA